METRLGERTIAATAAGTAMMAVIRQMRFTSCTPNVA